MSDEKLHFEDIHELGEYLRSFVHEHSEYRLYINNTFIETEFTQKQVETLEYNFSDQVQNTLDLYTEDEEIAEDIGQLDRAEDDIHGHKHLPRAVVAAKEIFWESYAHLNSALVAALDGEGLNANDRAKFNAHPEKVKKFDEELVRVIALTEHNLLNYSLILGVAKGRKLTIENMGEVFKDIIENERDFPVAVYTFEHIANHLLPEMKRLYRQGENIDDAELEKRVKEIRNGNLAETLPGYAFLWLIKAEDWQEKPALAYEPQDVHFESFDEMQAYINHLYPDTTDSQEKEILSKAMKGVTFDPAHRQVLDSYMRHPHLRIADAGDAGKKVQKVFWDVFYKFSQALMVIQYKYKTAEELQPEIIKGIALIERNCRNYTIILGLTQKGDVPARVENLHGIFNPESGAEKKDVENLLAHIHDQLIPAMKEVAARTPGWSREKVEQEIERLLNATPEEEPFKGFDDYPVIDAVKWQNAGSHDHD
jgi:hypothetical protein